MATGPIKQVTNNSGSNYCKMPDGTLIQWGVDTIASGNGSVTVTLPISFVDTNYGVAVVPDITTSQSGTYASGLFSVQRLYANQIRIHRGVGQASYSNTVYYIAIGRWK